ncbi:MAG: DUF58 domain-containing protein [Pirellulaceae bacterium]|nr:DUF58 domain-containing protein [Pirellulaceae bacterium]
MSSPSTTETPTRSRLRGAELIDPESLMRIKSLHARARAVVEGFLSGIHRSPFHGFSAEFSEYREYSPGDDLRYLDWRLYARSDRYYVKRFEDETNLRCYLLVDVSRSMGYGSGNVSKDHYARTAAATLAYFLNQQRDAVGLFTFAQEVLHAVPPRYRPGHLQRLIAALEIELQGHGTDLGQPLEQIAASSRKRGMVVLFSDMLTKIDKLEKQLGFLTSQGHEVVLMRILDPAEVEFDLEKPAMFHDMETGRDMYIDPAAAREEYQQRFSEHQQQVEQTCRKLGIDFFQFTTARPIEMVLFDYLSWRMQRGTSTSGRVRRRGNFRAGGAR